MTKEETGKFLAGGSHVVEELGARVQTGKDRRTQQTGGIDIDFIISLSS